MRVHQHVSNRHPLRRPSSVHDGRFSDGADASNFTLLNQFNEPVSLPEFRGHIVLLALIDSECTTVCPLTTVTRVHAVHTLGPAGHQVHLIAVDANP